MRSRIFRGNVFVANLPPELSDDQLAEAFDPCGIVLSAHVARDPETGARLRYGFVDIATERAAQRAVAAMNGTTLEGHCLDVRISERPAKKRATANRPGGPMRRAPSRPALSPHLDSTEGGYHAPSMARRQPSFQVERRSLPRRFSPR